MQNRRKSLEKKRNEIVRKFNEMSQIHHLVGRFDIIVEVIVRDIDELRSLLRKVQNPLAVKNETLIVCETATLHMKEP